MNATLVFLACLLSLGTPESAVPGGPAEPAQAPVKVKVVVSAREELGKHIRSLVATELRSCGPVQLVEKDADWTIQIVTTQLNDPNGVTLALGLSFVVEQHGIHARMLRALAQACRYFVATGLLRDAPLESDMKMLLRGVEALPPPEGLAVLSQHKMCVITPDQLARACQDMIAAFNAERVGVPPDAQPAAAPTGETP